LAASFIASTETQATVSKISGDQIIGTSAYTNIDLGRGGKAAQGWPAVTPTGPFSEYALTADRIKPEPCMPAERDVSLFGATN
jgi:hypothetical protein